jgi:hypothetical protein
MEYARSVGKLEQVRDRPLASCRNIFLRDHGRQAESLGLPIDNSSLSTRTVSLNRDHRL